MRARALALVLAASCGGAPPAAPRSASVETPRGTPCDRSAAQGARPFELSLSSAPGSAEVSVDGVPRLSTQAGGDASCAYLDLAPGAHAIALRAGGENALGVDFAVAGGNPKGPWWYDVFSFGCGASGACLREHLVAWREAARADRQKLTDPCSATQVREIQWQSERVPGTSQVTGVTLSFTLFVYATPFDQEPRDPSCPVN